MEPRTLGCKHRNCQNQLKKSHLNAIAAALLPSVCLALCLWPGVSGRCEGALTASQPPRQRSRRRAADVSPAS
eukprot:2500851-Prymnesium_polylepis.1